MSRILDLIFPEVCPVCDRAHNRLLTGEKGDLAGLCGACHKKIKRVKAPFCLHCGKPLPSTEEPDVMCMDCTKDADSPFVQGRAVFLYEGDMTLSMYRMKYSKKGLMPRALPLKQQRN